MRVTVGAKTDSVDLLKGSRAVQETPRARDEESEINPRPIAVTKELTVIRLVCGTRSSNRYQP